MTRVDAKRPAYAAITCAILLPLLAVPARAGTPGTHDEEIIIGLIIAVDLLLLAVFSLFRFLHRLWHPPAAAPDALLEQQHAASDSGIESVDDPLACLGTA